MRVLRIVATALLWTLQVLAALGFIGTGIAKFAVPFWIQAFARWGYPGWFRMLIGVLEIAGGLLLAFPRTASYAASLLCCILVGAAGTLVLHREPAAPPFVWFAVIAIVGIARFRRAWRPSAKTNALAVGQV
jgi:putative oxidoreductase